MARLTRRIRALPLLALALFAAAPAAGAEAVRDVAGPRILVTFPASLDAGPITGRVFVILATDSVPEPRFQVGGWFGVAPLFGADVSGLKPGEAAVVGGSAAGYPVRSLAGLPEGDYYVQAVLNVYTQFHRADGHTIWAHMDHWEGQNFVVSPGNLVSSVRRVHYDPKGGPIRIALERKLPQVKMPDDTKWVKHVKIRSEMLSKFWGHDMYLGATVLLPRDYDTETDRRYPVVFQFNHFNLRPPFDFTTDSVALPSSLRAFMASLGRETPFQLYKQWVSDDFPRMIAVTIQHPTPYFDDSYAVNSVNNGPYGDAIRQELIPYLEQHFRMIGKPWARVLTGASTGGWIAMALQVRHPEFFGGTWVFCPDPIDFRNYQLTDIYHDANAFIAPGGDRWNTPERFMMRTPGDGQPMVTTRQMSQLEDALGTHGRSGQQYEIWEAAWGPIGDDGYPVPLWDKRTGVIDHDVAEYMRAHGFDLRDYLQRNWATVGPHLVGQIHVYVGDVDDFYLNLAVYRMRDFLESTTDPYYAGAFHFGRPAKGHGWQGQTTASLLRKMARHIEASAPGGHLPKL